MVEVRRLIHPDMLIEIEADAYASMNSSQPKPKTASKEKTSRQVNKSGVKKPAAKKPAAKKSARRK
jgi:hypothetical protein